MKTLPMVYMFLLGLLFYLQPAFAESPYEVKFGDFTVNYNVYPSSFLKSEIANALKLRQSPNQGVITIAARKAQADGSEQPIKANIQVRTRNIIGRVHTARLIEVVDDGHIYYMGNFPITQNETTQFEIEVLPAGNGPSHRFAFSRLF